MVDENTEIGKEPEQLDAKDVKVVEVEIREQKNKDGKVVGDKLVLRCQHPDLMEKPIEISQAIYLRGKNIKTSGLWIGEDDEGRIPFNSAVANVLRYAKTTKVNELLGKTIHTAKNDDGFLIVKAY